MITPKGLEAETVRQETLKVLQEHVHLNIHGYAASEQMVLEVLRKAASEHQSSEAACGELGEVAASNTIREQVNRVITVKTLRAQEEALNSALSAWLPQGIRERVVDIALDTHDEPCYAKTVALAGYTCRGAAQSGTTHFVRIASAYLVWRGARLTLAVTYVLPADSLVQVVQRLLARLRTVGLRWQVLYMDKGSVVRRSSITYKRTIRPRLLLVRFMDSVAAYGLYVGGIRVSPPPIPFNPARKRKWRSIQHECLTRQPENAVPNGWLMSLFISVGWLLKPLLPIDVALALNLPIDWPVVPQPSLLPVILLSASSS